jgi:hypothetical protein
LWWGSVAYPLVVGAIAFATLSSSDTALISLAAAAVALTAAGLVAVPTSAANHLSTGVAVATSLPLLFRTQGRVDLATVIGVYAAGLGATLLLRLALGEPQRRVVANLSRRLVSFAAYAVVFALVSQISIVMTISSGWQDVVPVIAGTMAWMGMEVVLSTLSPLERNGDSRRYLALATLKDLNVMAGLAATGALFGIAFPTIGWWALGVAALPYIFAHSAFRRFQATKITYRQTIRALARIPEVAGLGASGHADRTADLALAMAKDLGMNPGDIEDLEFAALMHDIGRITLTDPSIVAAGYTDDDIAHWGAEIIAQASYLDRVAEHVRRINEPFRSPGELADPSVSMISKILRAASAYDHALHEEKVSSLQAMEVLHEGAAYNFDPEVVASLRRVLERRATFHPLAAPRTLNQ